MDSTIVHHIYQLKDYHHSNILINHFYSPIVKCIKVYPGRQRKQTVLFRIFCLLPNILLTILNLSLQYAEIFFRSITLTDILQYITQGSAISRIGIMQDTPVEKNTEKEVEPKSSPYYLKEEKVSTKVFKLILEHKNSKIFSWVSKNQSLALILVALWGLFIVVMFFWFILSNVIKNTP